jgi:UDP:flavonoid glycosyltransferase YjiC (YdhE family)
LAEPSFTARAQEIAAWGRANDGATRGADLVERLARRRAAQVGG